MMPCNSFRLLLKRYKHFSWRASDRTQTFCDYCNFLPWWRTDHDPCSNSWLLIWINSLEIDVFVVIKLIYTLRVFLRAEFRMDVYIINFLVTEFAGAYRFYMFFDHVLLLLLVAAELPTTRETIERCIHF